MPNPADAGARASLARPALRGRVQDAWHRWRGSPYLQVVTIFGALVVLWVVLSLTAPFFLTERNILNIFLQSAVVGILAAAFTLVLIGGEIDVSISSVQALAGTLAAVLVIEHGIPLVPGMLLVLGMGALAGLINGYLTAFATIPSFITTLAMLGVAQGLAFVITSGRTIGGFPDAYLALGQNEIGPVPVPVVIAAVVFLVLHLLLTQTRFGVELYAVGGSRRAASRVGIRVTRIIVVTFVIAGILSAIAGIVLSARVNSGSGTVGATSILLDAIAAVVIGGTSLEGGAGTMLGTLGGVLIISTIRNGLILLHVDPFWQQVAVGVIIVLAVLVDQVFKGKLRLRDLVRGRPSGLDED
ncbi:MAG: ribose transport system permease protein [Thermoleophilaceae bacterium]|jgi:ribose transport system permease protein|nr:ribose transport system permease protein [Thermoleophilaceae bacterium]